MNFWHGMNEPTDEGVPRGPRGTKKWVNAVWFGSWKNIPPFPVCGQPDVGIED